MVSPISERGRTRPTTGRRPPRAWLPVVVALGLAAALAVWSGTGGRVAGPPSPPDGFPSSAHALMVFDPAASQSLLLDTVRPGQLWAFDLDGDEWSRLAEGPGAPSVPAMAFDAESGLLVVIGSDWAAGATTVDVYDPVAGTWERRNDAPEYRDDWWSGGWLQAAYDAASDRVVLATDWGAFWSYDVDTDRWQEGLNPWTQAPSGRLRDLPASPPPCLGWNQERPMTYDAGIDRIVIAGHGDLCLYHAGAALLEVRRSGTGPDRVAAASYDPVAGRVVLLADGAVWTYHTSSDRLARIGPTPKGLSWTTAATTFATDSGLMVVHDGTGTWSYDLGSDSWSLLRSPAGG